MERQEITDKLREQIKIGNYSEQARGINKTAAMTSFRLCSTILRKFKKKFRFRGILSIYIKLFTLPRSINYHYLVKGIF